MAGGKGVAAIPGRKWDEQSKAAIILQGLKGRPVADICTEHQISQAHYYRWRDRFLTNMHQTFESRTSRESMLNQQVNELKKVVGDLTLELKKRRDRMVMVRKESSKIVERNLPVVTLMREIKKEHPFWGYRRIWAFLKYVDGLDDNSAGFPADAEARALGETEYPTQGDKNPSEE